MLSEVKYSNQFQLSIPDTWLEDKNKSTLSSCTTEGEGVSNMCKQPSDKLSLIQQLYSEMLLPYMQSSGVPFVKVSRKTCPLLENSIWAHRNGSIFEQYHSKDQNSVLNGEGKRYVGEGGRKMVWKLKPLPINAGCPEMVRARFIPEELSRRSQARLEAFQKFGKELDSPYLLIPDMVITTDSKGEKAVYQMMPKAFADFSKISNKLTHLGRLRAMRDAGLGSISMHEKGWGHLHFTTANILIMNRKKDNPDTKLCDFDMSIKFGNGLLYAWRTDHYTDPKCLRYKADNLEDAKIHDQFSFGVILCEILTGHLLRKDFADEKLREWVTEEDLQAVRGFSMLSETFKNIIRNCCLGSGENRPYRLPELVEVIKNEIDHLLESIKERAEKNCEKWGLKCVVRASGL